MVYGTYNELVTGANLNQLITGGPHIVVDGTCGIHHPTYHRNWMKLLYFCLKKTSNMGGSICFMAVEKGLSTWK